MTYDITIKRKVKVSLSPDEWQLFTDMPGVKGAAHGLNLAASRALSLPTKDEAWVEFRKAQERWQNWGAYDTEPRNVFHDLVDQVFGDG